MEDRGVFVASGASATWSVSCGLHVKIYASWWGFQPKASRETMYLGKYGLLVIGFFTRSPIVFLLEGMHIFMHTRIALGTMIGKPIIVPKSPICMTLCFVFLSVICFTRGSLWAM